MRGLNGGVGNDGAAAAGGVVVLAGLGCGGLVAWWYACDVERLKCSLRHTHLQENMISYEAEEYFLLYEEIYK